DKRDPHTAADVARQVHQARRRVVLSRRQIRIGRGVDGHEQKRKPRRLQDARQHYGSKINVEVERGHVEQRQRQRDQAEHQQVARVVAPQQKPNQRKQQHDRESARRKRHAGQLGGIAEQRLRHQRQQQRASQQRE